MDGAGLFYLFVLLLGFYSFFLVRKRLLFGLQWGAWVGVRGGGGSAP